MLMALQANWWNAAKDVGLTPTKDPMAGNKQGE